jgi:hypothetical protein
LHELTLKVAFAREPADASRAMLENVQRLGEFGWRYLTPVGVVLLVMGTGAALLAGDRLQRMLVGVATAYVAAFVLAARDLTAHYLLPVLPFCVLAMAHALVVVGSRLPSRLRAVAIATVLAAIAARAAPFWSALWTDPASAPFASTERRHYIDGRWSGYGFPEAARWIERELASDAPGAAVVAAVHLADYERLALYVDAEMRRAIVQVQVERRTVPLGRRIDRMRSLAASRQRVLVVVGSASRWSGAWREAFPSAVRRAAFPRPEGEEYVEVWELAATDGSPAQSRISLPSSTSTAPPAVTVASGKNSQRTVPPVTAPPSSELSPRLMRTTPAP